MQVQASKGSGLWFPKAVEHLQTDTGAKFFAKCPGYGASESKNVQPFWAKLISKLPMLDHVTLVDTHNKESLGNRKPGEFSYWWI